MEVNITEIQITPIKPVKGLVAFASFILNNSIYLGSIGLFTKPKGGYRLVYPTKKVGSHNLNIYFPISRSFAEAVEEVVIAGFKKLINKKP